MKKTKNLLVQGNRRLIKLEKVLEGPMIVLGFVWLIILIIEFIYGFNRALEIISTVIWVVFIIDFLLKLFLAPEKLLFLRKNILTVVSLIIPAFRLFRIFRFIRLMRFFRGTRLIKVIASLNRGMNSLNSTMERRGFAYVMALTIVVIFAGAAGMYTFESENGGLPTYYVSLWWTMMLVITVGTDFWPRTAEGRILCTMLSLYGFAVFGYITATLASFFVGRDAQDKAAPIASSVEISELKLQIAELTSEIRKLSAESKK